MTKKEIIEKLTAAGVEAPANANVATLKALAEEKGVSIEVGDDTKDDQPPAAAAPEITEEAIAEKTRAGLTREQAIEVLKAQAAHDAQLAAAEAK